MEFNTDNKKPTSTNQNHTMDVCVSFDDFKKALGEEADKHSDEFIEKLRKLFDQIADTAFDNWLKKTNSSIIIDNKI